jgi:hypothetical protein
MFFFYFFFHDNLKKMRNIIGKRGGIGNSAEQSKK